MNNQHHTPNLLKKIWDLNLDRNPRWRDNPNLWPVVEECLAHGFKDSAVLDAQADLLFEKNALNARRFLRACQAQLQKERR